MECAPVWDSYHICREIDDALDLLHHYDGEAKIIAGGTDLILQLEAMHRHVPAVIDISQIEALGQISKTEDHISIGSAVTFREVIHSSVIRQHAPHLIMAAEQIAGRQIRNVATVGGNIANASPAADSVPVLLTLDARVHYLQHTGRTEYLPLEDFLLGVNQTALPADGLVTAIDFPIRGEGWHQSFRKLGLRRAMAIAVVNVALSLFESDGIVQEARFAFGAVAPTAVRALEAEQCLSGKVLTHRLISEAAGLARNAVVPIDDFRASADYRLRMVEGILREELSNLSAEYGTEVQYAS